MLEVIGWFAVSLILTLAIEGVVAFCLGVRGRKAWLVFVLVNLLTNPLTVLVTGLVSMLCSLPHYWIELPFEIIVIVAETMIYRYFARNTEINIPHPVLLGVLSNAISWLAGVLIYELI